VAAFNCAFKKFVARPPSNMRTASEGVCSRIRDLTLEMQQSRSRFNEVEHIAIDDVRRRAV